MHKPLSKLGVAGLAAYLTVWLCFAPMLVLCVCAGGHERIALNGHEAPVCDGHAPHEHVDDDAHGGIHAGYQGETGDREAPGHRDRQLVSDELLPTKTPMAHCILPAPLVGILESADALLPRGEMLNRLDGPPRPLRAAIHCTILLL